jgi:hypothetical protein
MMKRTLRAWATFVLPVILLFGLGIFPASAEEKLEYIPLTFSKITDICKADPPKPGEDPNQARQSYTFDWDSTIYTQLYSVLPRSMMAQHGAEILSAVKTFVLTYPAQSGGKTGDTSRSEGYLGNPSEGLHILCDQLGSCSSDHGDAKAPSPSMDSLKCGEKDSDACKLDVAIKSLVALRRRLKGGGTVDIPPYAVITGYQTDSQPGTCRIPGKSPNPNLGETAANSLTDNLIGLITGESKLLPNFKLRLTSAPSQLLIPSGVSLPPGSDTSDTFVSSTNEVYQTGSGAKLSFGETSGSNQVSNQVIGTLGLQYTPELSYSFVHSLSFTPYMYIDREEKLTNIHDESPSQQFSQNLWGGGIDLSPVLRSQNPGQELWVVGVRPDYQINYCNNSQLASLNLTQEPIGTEGLPINRLVNVPWDAASGSAAWKWTALVNLRENFGWYQNRAANVPVLTVNTLCSSKTGAPTYQFPTDPRVTQDFTRLGGQAGIALELRCLIPPFSSNPDRQGYVCSPDNPIDVSATYTDFYPVTGFQKSLGYFETLGKWSLGKGFSLNANYSNGRRPDNGMRYEAWSIGLGLTF